MFYDFKQLSILQSNLDKRILDLHNIKEDECVSERILAFIVEVSELANETRCFKYWSLKDASTKEVILEEYVDGIHFLLSLANSLDLKVEFMSEKEDQQLTLIFIEIFEMASKLANNFNQENLKALFIKYLILGELLNFDNEEIRDGYLLKNKKNHNRQDEGY